MAKNNGRKQLFNIALQETMEQEGMNRRLKEAGIYDHNDTYETRKELDQMLQQSKEDAKQTEKSVPSEQTVTSFDDDFNIVADDDDELKEISHTDTTTSTNRIRKKSPSWLFDSENEEENLQTLGKPCSSSRVETKPFQKNASKLQKAKTSSIDSKKLVQTSPVSYGSKMVAASIQKRDGSTESPNSSRPLSSRRGDLIISSDEIDDVYEFPLKIEPLKRSSRNGNSRKGETTTEKKSDDTQDDDFIDDPPPRQKEYVNRTKTEQSNPSQKAKLATMKTLCKKYSEMLNRVENVEAHPMPEDFDYDSKGPSQLLIENEEKLKVIQSLGYKPIKWRKPIILSANSNRRRRQIFNQPSTSRTTPPVDAQEDSVDAVEIVCDSPPAASMRKLDISPASPIFESRKRSGGSNGIIGAEMEVDRKSPIENKEDSATQECPICGKLFQLSVIEGHADGCINNMEERPRSERIARNARSNKSYNAWPEYSQWGKGDRAAGSSSETVDPDVIFDTDGSQTDSDFEPDQDPGTKRSQRKTASVGVKKRRM